jgi:hypothetical protein
MSAKGSRLNLVSDLPLDPPLRSLYELIKRSDFYLENRLEPKIGSQEWNAILEQDEEVVAYVNPQLMGKSIYTHFLKGSPHKCRICDSTKGSLVRAVACVRAHLDHRPFYCLGAEDGCKRCDRTHGYAHLELGRATTDDGGVLGTLVAFQRNSCGTI